MSKFGEVEKVILDTNLGFPGYYDFVFLYKNKVFATMLTKFYKPDELLNKSDAELEKLMKQ